MLFYRRLGIAQRGGGQFFQVAQLRRGNGAMRARGRSRSMVATIETGIRGISRGACGCGAQGGAKGRNRGQHSDAQSNRDSQAAA